MSHLPDADVCTKLSRKHPESQTKTRLDPKRFVEGISPLENSCLLPYVKANRARFILFVMIKLETKNLQTEYCKD